MFTTTAAEFTADAVVVPMLITATYETSRKAEDIASDLANAGYGVRVNRYGTGNGCMSGRDGNGVRSLEVEARYDENGTRIE